VVRCRRVRGRRGTSTGTDVRLAVTAPLRLVDHGASSREEDPMSVRLRHGLIVAAAIVFAATTASSASAAAPQIFGPFEMSETVYLSDCGFAVRLDTEVTETFTVFLDENGELARVIDRVRAPHDVFTNLETGRSIVVRGEFQEFIERIPNTGDFTKTVSGFRYLVNERGVGVTIRDVGRIVYGDLAQTIVLWQAGEHDLALEEDIQPTFCAALAQ